MPFIPNVFSPPYQFDNAISIFMVVGWYFHFYSNFKRNVCKQAVENLIRRRVLRRLVWFCAVCRCPTKKAVKNNYALDNWAQIHNKVAYLMI